MATEQITVEVSRIPESGTELLKVAGPMTLNTLFEFQDGLRAAVGPKTIIDLTEVPYMDSAGLGSVISYHVSCSRHQRKYALCGVSPRLRTMMEVAGVDNLLHIFHTAADAEAFLAK